MADKHPYENDTPVGDLSLSEVEFELIEYSEKTELKSKDDPEEPSRPGTTEECDEDIYIVVSGKQSNGKSTALNNIFDLNLKTGMGPKSVTTRNLKHIVPKGGIKVHVIDTPGLGALDIDKMDVLKRIDDDIRDKNFIFLYCLSVAPGNPITELDESIIKAVHQCFGKSIWRHCVVLFTFSDCARQRSTVVEDYKKHIQDYSEVFYELLQREGADITRFMTVFDYADEVERRKDTNSGIVAVPVCDVVDPEQHDILPGVLHEGDDWTEIVFDEIMKKVDGRTRNLYFRLKYRHTITRRTVNRESHAGGSHQAPTVQAPTIPAPTVPAPTIPASTVPAPTVSAPTVPAPTVPAPTIPAPTIPAPTVPATTGPAPTIQEAPPTGYAVLAGGVIAGASVGAGLGALIGLVGGPPGAAIGAVVGEIVSSTAVGVIVGGAVGGALGGALGVVNEFIPLGFLIDSRRDIKKKSR